MLNYWSKLWLEEGGNFRMDGQLGNFCIKEFVIEFAPQNETWYKNLVIKLSVKELKAKNGSFSLSIFRNLTRHFVAKL